MTSPLTSQAPDLTGQTVEQRLIACAETMRDHGLLVPADFHRAVNRIRAMARIQENVRG